MKELWTREKRYPGVDFTDKQRLEIWFECGGICCKCRRKLRPAKDKWRADHILPRALGGATSVSNGQVLCLDCDGIKTPQDIRRIRDADRAAKKHLGIGSERRQPWPKRAFRRINWR